jgi:kynurenine formamidase
VERQDGRGRAGGDAQAIAKNFLMTEKIYDLGQPYYVGMPHHPAHPPFLRSLNKLHGEYVLENGASSSSETITLGGHVGTHIDALSHFSCDGKLHGGVVPTQTHAGGVAEGAVTEIEPIFRRGVLLDVAGLVGVDALGEDFVITPDHLAACKVALDAGCVALIRTGWARYWGDAKRFINGVTGPGPAAPAARWLSDRGIFAAGSDTVAFEKVPSKMEVHVHLLVEKGIHIIECLDLEELARDGVKKFKFVALPLKIQGGTGSPIRPVAVV